MLVELRSANLKLDKTTAKPYIMNDGQFEWDDAKAAENDAKHGVTFEMARDVFRDPFAPEWLDAIGATVKTASSPSVWSKGGC